jgi:hypothetical protein
MLSKKILMHVRLLTGLAKALPIGAPSAVQDTGRITEAPRATIIKFHRPTLGLFTRNSSSDTFQPIQARTSYETIPTGGLCAHSKFWRQLCKKEPWRHHYARRRHATSKSFALDRAPFRCPPVHAFA